MQYIIALVIVVFLFRGCGDDAPAQPKSAAEIRTDQLRGGFSAWDGSHRALEKIIKASMNDPESYEHVKTVYVDEGESLIVTTTFRGKNAFGGIVTQSVTARAAIDGAVTEIISED